MKKKEKQDPKKNQEPFKDKSEEHQEGNTYGILPHRNLKKNLGCGG